MNAADEKLFQAAAAGDVQAMKTAMVAGANVDAQREGTLDTPLHVAAALGHEQVVALLIEAGADVDAQNLAMRTALHESSFLGTPGIWNRLIEGFARDDVPDRDGQTPSMLRDSLIWGKAMSDFSRRQVEQALDRREVAPEVSLSR